MVCVTRVINISHLLSREEEEEACRLRDEKLL